MAVINITISESSIQLLAGVPKSISVTTNIPSTVFYTLDGTDPNINSDIIAGTLTLPTDSYVVLKLFATDGTNSSAIISKTYGDSINKVRKAHASVANASFSEKAQQDPFPFGTIYSQDLPIYDGVAGLTVDNAAIAGYPDGYDGTATGTPAANTDLPLSEYDIVYTKTNRKGETGRGIGTLPATVSIRIPEPAPSNSSTSSKLFNPRAMVIFQDGTQPPADPDLIQINREYFDLRDFEKTNDGTAYSTSGFDGNLPRGSFLRQHFNPRDNTMTYYYRDSISNRWIISKEPYVNKNKNLGALYNIVFSSRPQDSTKVFKWIPFKGRYLM